MVFLFYASQGFAAEILTGKLTDVTGEVEVQKRGAAAWVRATAGMTVNPGDQINTGLDGRAKLSFKNSVTEIEPLTQFVVGRAFEDDKNVNTELFLQIGKVVSNVDPKSAKANKFTVTTPTAVAGVRGTRQECSFDRGFGTKVEIQDGAGYMSPVKADKLPPAVQAMLGVAPSGGGREGGVGKGDEKRADAGGAGPKPEAPAAVAEAVAAFNEWIQQAEAGLSGGGEGATGEAGEADLVLDASTLDYVIEVGDGLSAEIQDAEDVEAVSEPQEIVADDAAPDVTPEGTAPEEDEAQQYATEIVDAPPSVEAQETFEAMADEIAAFEALISPTTTTTTVTPPNRPTQGQSQGQQP